MAGLINKFAGQVEETPRGPVYFPRRFGMPVRIPGHDPKTGPPMYRAQELQAFEPTSDFHAKAFNMLDPDHLDEYQRVMDKVVNGAYRLCAKSLPIPDLANRAIWVLVDWVLTAAEPTERH